MNVALKLIGSHRPLVIGHRGYCEFAPENTLPSFKLALEAGADLVELDCRQSHDGTLVVIHDAELDRTTDAKLRWGGRHIKVGTRTAAEIQSLDAGSWFDKKYAGTSVPLLSEALDLIQKHGVTLLERKGGDLAACLALLRSKNLINKVVVQSFDWAFLREFHHREPAQLLAALGPPAVLPHGPRRPVLFRGLNGGWLKRIEKTGARVVVWNKQVSSRAVRLAHQRGLKVWVYTINETRLAERLLARGVDGLITNNVG
ncbi:MAG TPA: glycerophosphodiester phosphodiesterase family protein, partial [Candidatus Binatia bacterium]|nr:glycerophosphodiester phosphodiesterase family protein [Candidatus Binatia bacterium]